MVAAPCIAAILLYGSPRADGVTATATAVWQTLPPMPTPLAFLEGR